MRGHAFLLAADLVEQLNWPDVRRDLVGPSYALSDILQWHEAFKQGWSLIMKSRFSLWLILMYFSEQWTFISLSNFQVHVVFNDNSWLLSWKSRVARWNAWHAELHGGVSVFIFFGKFFDDIKFCCWLNSHLLWSRAAASTISLICVGVEFHEYLFELAGLIACEVQVDTHILRLELR